MAPLLDVACIVPEGLALCPSSCGGTGLFATKAFAKGEMVYEGKMMKVPNEAHKYALFTANQGSFEMDTSIHSVQCSSTHLFKFSFDGFMNHSCDPNTYNPPQTVEEEYCGTYRRVASKGIFAGDELTCNYNLFEYDCGTKTIESCKCGAKRCMKKVAGFKYLSDIAKEGFLSEVEEYVLHMADKEGIIKYCGTLVVPETVRIVESVEKCPTGTFQLCAARAFKQDETIFVNQSELVGCGGLSGKVRPVVVELPSGTRVWLKREHFCRRSEDTWEFFGFDSFQNHSCDPNTKMVYSDNSLSYSLVAVRKIDSNEELTVDYETIDANLDKDQFSCKCGAIECRGIIKST